MTYPIKKLGEVCDVVIGGTPRRDIAKYWDGGDLPWVSIADLSRNGREIFDTKEKITVMGAKESNVKLLKKGTLLFSFKLSIGKLAFAGTDLYTNEAIAGLLIQNELTLNEGYLYYYLQQFDFSGAQRSVKGATLNKTKIRNLLIPLPPIAEQKRIVAKIEKRFAKIDEVICLRAESATLATELLPAALHEFFSSAESKGWEVKKIAEVCEHPQYGFTASASRESVGPKFLRITDIQNGGVDWSSVPFCRCVAVAKYQLRSGDLVFARTGATVGKSFLITDVPDQAVFASYLIRLRAQKSIIPEFLFYFFQSPDYWHQISDGQTGMQPNVNGTKLAKMKISLPSLAEQKEIVKKLNAISEKVRALRELQAKQADDLKALKQSILAQAFQNV